MAACIDRLVYIDGFGGVEVYAYKDDIYFGADEEGHIVCYGFLDLVSKNSPTTVLGMRLGLSALSAPSCFHDAPLILPPTPSLLGPLKRPCSLS